MSRVKRGTVVKRRHKKVLALTKGYKHGRNNLFRQAKQAVLKAGMFAYRDRKVKKRTFRGQWIIMLNAAVRQHELSYSQFAAGLKKADLNLNRKVLAELAAKHPDQFATVVQKVKQAA